ncbi:DNA primase large subunit Spp2 [Rhodotorula sphaerocarpa]
MSGISFKIQAPPRPSAVRNGSGSGSGSAPPRRRDDAESPRASGSATPARSQSRSASIRADESDSDAEGDSGARDAASRRKRAKLLGEGDEEVVEFGADGARSKHAKAPTGPLVIAALPNKDWRKAAEELRAGRNPNPGRRKKELYIPEGASAGAMRMQSLPGSASSTASPASGVDAINTEEVVGGLSARPAMQASGPTEEAVERVRQEIDTVEVATPPGSVPPESAPAAAPAPAALTDEQRALRELLGHDATAGETEQIPEAIYSAPDDRGKPIDETEAFKRDVDTRPDEASLDDYARVPVGQFGMAMLRGMGWQPGQAASRSGRGAVEAHVPSSRPSLLGIGAKPMAEQLDTGTDAKGGKAGGGMPPRRNTKREDMRFMPLMKRERTDEGGSRGGSSEPSTLPRFDLVLPPAVRLASSSIDVDLFEARFATRVAEPS